MGVTIRKALPDGHVDGVPVVPWLAEDPHFPSHRGGMNPAISPGASIPAFSLSPMYSEYRMIHGGAELQSS